MKCLVTGATGLLGAHVMAEMSRQHEVVGIDRHPWWGERPLPLIHGDLRDPAFIADAVGAARPDVVVHCAANVSVDACEEDPVAAFADNADVTRRIARVVPPGCLVVYITTDGLFKGDTAFVDEGELPCPRTVYARSKLHGEWEVQLATDDHLIVRTNFYGWSSGRKRTSAEWLYHALAKREPITLFDDFYFTPIYVVDLAQRLRVLAEERARGIFHLCGRDRVTKYDFGALLASHAGLPFDHVRRGSIHDAALSASRPPDMSLSSERFVALTGVPVPGCREGLARFVADRGRGLFARAAAADVDRARVEQPR